VIYTATDATGSNQKILTVTVNEVEVPKTGCFSSFNASSTLYLTFAALGVMGVAYMYLKNKKGSKVN
jgi:hypothetical protein